MRLRTFHAPDMNKAMQMVRTELGDDAVIISSERGAGKSGVTLTAAVEREEPVAQPHPLLSRRAPEATKPSEKAKPAVPPPAVKSTTQEQRHTLYELRKLLRFHNLTEELIEQIMEKARGIDLAPVHAPADLEKVTARFLRHVFSFSPIAFDKEGWKIMLVGPTGIGKTLTVAKIATSLVMAKKKVLVISTDIKRAGGIEQLESFLRILNVELVTADSGAKLRAILQACPKSTRVLIDSAGANPYSFDELKELGEFTSISEIEPVLVTPAGGDVLEAEEIARAYSFLGIRRMLVTRADAARRCGGILSAAFTADLEFSHLSASTKVVEACQPLTPDMLARLLTKHQMEL